MTSTGFRSAWQGVWSLDVIVNRRIRRPRTTGVTMIIDTGLGATALRDVLALAGLPDRALVDLAAAKDLADPGTPWAEILDAYCRFDSDRVERLAADRRAGMLDPCRVMYCCNSRVVRYFRKVQDSSTCGVCL